MAKALGAVRDAAVEAGEAPYIVCEDLFKIYKIADLEVVALRGLDLHVKRGELMAIVGSSGSGKSTLLNILAGLDVPSAGRCSVGGLNLLTATEDELVHYRRDQVGFVWQQTGRNLIPYLSAAQNVEIPMVLRGDSRVKARERSTELLEAVGLGKKLESRPERLSGGEQQRVSIAVALANDPPLLLADEPTGELDSHTAEEVFAVLRSLNERYGVTIVVVTHDPAIAAQVDRVVTIRDGRISTETYRRAAFEGAGAASVVYDEYTVVDRTGRLQIPKEYVERLGLKERAKVYLEADHVEVYPPGGEESKR